MVSPLLSAIRLQVTTIIHSFVLIPLHAIRCTSFDVVAFLLNFGTATTNLAEFLGTCGISVATIDVVACSEERRAAQRQVGNLA